MEYQQVDEQTILRVSDGASIPKDELNRDYRDFLVWVKEGNTPAPAPAPLPTRQLSAIDRLAAMGITLEELKDLLGIKK
jgi:hypothetical protein